MEKALAMNYVVRACNDSRFRADNFVISEVTAEMIRRNGIDMTIAEFKRLVRLSPPAFVTHTGNTRIAPLLPVNVYSMAQIKEIIAKTSKE